MPKAPREILNKRIRKSKWRSRGVLNLEKAENLFQNKTECYLCFSKEDLHIDHCHKTGQLRKSLCSHCNRGLGCFKDRSDLLRKAANYLDEHRNFVYN